MDVRFQRSGREDADEKVSLINDGGKVPAEKPAHHAGDHDHAHGLGVITTTVFIVGVIAGAGFLTLPRAIEDAGNMGFVLLFLCCLAAVYTGDILGRCWTLAQEQSPALRQGSVRYPYPAIGEVAYGKLGRYVVSFSVNFTQFGTTVVYTLIAAENIVKLLPEGTSINCCYMALIVGAVMTPFTWLGTPKEFWGIAALASLATGTASLIVLASTIHHGADVVLSEVVHTDVTVISFFSAYGTICFAYNGHPCFPTFQSDMKNPKRFRGALVLGYLVVLLIYSPSSIAAYLIYGEATESNVINTMPQGAATTVVSILMTSHLLFGIVIVINPVSQELEHLIKIPDHFTWKRVVSRTLMMGAVLFVAMTIPHFSSILSLVGGSTVSNLSFICPPLFYLKLCRGTEKNKERVIPLHVRVLLYEIVFIGLVAGVAATYSAATDLVVNKFTVPCYINPITACPKQ